MCFKKGSTYQYVIIIIRHDMILNTITWPEMMIHFLKGQFNTDAETGVRESRLGVVCNNYVTCFEFSACLMCLDLVFVY